MKYTKKLLSLVLVLVLALAVPGFAANATVTIDGNANATYDVYKIMTLNRNGANYAYKVTDKWKEALIEIGSIDTEGKTDAAVNQAILDYVAAQDEAAETRALAEKLFDKTSTIAADLTGQESGFEVEQGYYLIVEVKGTTTGGVVKSLVMLDTAGEAEVTIDAKVDTMSLTKKILEDVNKNEEIEANEKFDAIDAAIGDTITFELTSQLPADLALYTDYKFVVTDNLEDGFTNGTITSIKIGDTELINKGYGGSTIVTAGGTTTIDLSSYITEGTDADKKVVITYTAQLDTDANIGSSGNSNTAYLTFSNDPNHTGEGTDGTTPVDTVKVFTYQVTVNKVDKDKHPLEGAGFTLQKKNAEGTYVTVGEEMKGEKMVNFLFKGLDRGEYKISETTTPPGYNTAADIEFTISNSEQNVVENANPAMGDVQISVTAGGATFNEADGIFSTDVVNMTGTELPSTGGMGTTIFYTLGGVLVVGAAILLVTKKRVHDVEG